MIKIGSTCADRSIARYYRYDAYGKTTAYDTAGASTPIATALFNGFVPERLYTGQRWDDAGQVYDYGARFYDPRVARFLTHDPVQQYMNPYAYVMWNPLKFVDPTGTFGELSAAFILARDFAVTQAYRAAGHGGFNGPHGGGAGGGFGAGAGGLAPSIAAFVASVFEAAGDGTQTPTAIGIPSEFANQSGYASVSAAEGFGAGFSVDVSAIAGFVYGAAGTAGGGFVTFFGGAEAGGIDIFSSVGSTRGPDGLSFFGSGQPEHVGGIGFSVGITFFITSAGSFSEFKGPGSLSFGGFQAGFNGITISLASSPSGVQTFGFSPFGFGFYAGGATINTFTRSQPGSM